MKTANNTSSYTHESQQLFASELFKAVQMANVFNDSKTFADATPKLSLKKILEQYEIDKRNIPNFNLLEFVQEYFLLPQQSEICANERHIDVQQHIEQLWQLLEKPADNLEANSLLPLKSSYIVPGGRFREIYYWDSYFSALGLIQSNNVQLVESMINNFIDLQTQYGCIPNGNRSYYLSRSQPPVLALLVDLVLPYKQDKPKFLTKAVKAIETEYQFWMLGCDSLSDTHTEHARVVRMSDGSLLNRYWDNDATPRPESYSEDMELAKGLSAQDKSNFYRNIRAACESGWDFSARWLTSTHTLSAIRTTRVLPIDLNCLLYQQECLLAKYYAMLGNDDASLRYTSKSQQRKSAIQRYMWSEKEGFFLDYDLDVKAQSPVKSLAGTLPLFVELADEAQADRMAQVIEKDFLKSGGLVTTLVESQQQWDAPNGWAPLHWFAVQGLMKYQNQTLANTIMQRWQQTIEQYFDSTGKIMEKYDVCQQSNKAGGGEYDVQEGFGWTNGVYQAFLSALESPRQ